MSSKNLVVRIVAAFLFMLQISRTQAQKPNVLIILADDLGYSDLGCYGSEISTPNLDALAEEGIKYRHFYNSARCCPSRAALLTGRHPHEAGMGGMVSMKNKPVPPGPYQGFLRKDIPTMAELFRDAGYRTLMSGKWHVGEGKEHWPLQRGFDRYFGLVSGASSYYEVLPNRLMLNQNDTFLPPPGFYATDAYADSASSFMKQAIREKKPFLCYAPFTAPHWPLHAPDSVVAKYRERYLLGWDKLRQARFEKQKQLGLVPKQATLERWSEIALWETVPDKKAEAEKMAVYAAMVEIMDRGIGRMVQMLKASGQFENTLILFLSDNGGCAENIRTRAQGDGLDTTIALRLPPGPKGSYVAYGKNWAHLSNTPFRYHKQTIHEGGVASPFLFKPAGKANLPGLDPSGTLFITDILPGLLRAAGQSYPAQWKGNNLSSLPGSDFRNAKGERTYAWEHTGNRGIREGNRKLVALKGKPWELYDLEADPFETKDLSAKEPGRVSDLEKKWKEWAVKVGVKESSEFSVPEK